MTQEQLDRADRLDCEAEAAEALVLSLARVVEQQDRETGVHCERVAYLSVQMGWALGLRPEQLRTLHHGGYLHDIGKVAVPDAILFKPAELTRLEWIAMRSHTLRGEAICQPLKALEPLLPVIRSHHERWDGSGYPDGLQGDQIPLLARLLQIADIYDALTSDRPYKAAMDPQAALAVLEEETDRGWRDPELMSIFRDVHRRLTSVNGPLTKCRNPLYPR